MRSTSLKQNNMRIFSFPISTSIDIVSPNEQRFPRVTICNTNPLQYFKFPDDSPLENVVKSASDSYNIDTSIFNSTSVGHFHILSRLRVPVSLRACVRACVRVCVRAWSGVSVKTANKINFIKFIFCP